MAPPLPSIERRGTAAAFACLGAFYAVQLVQLLILHDELLCRHWWPMLQKHIGGHH